MNDMDEWLLLGVMLWMISFGIVYLIYKSKHRPTSEGIFLTVVLGVLAIPIALLVSDKSKEVGVNESGK